MQDCIIHKSNNSVQISSNIQYSDACRKQQENQEDTDLNYLAHIDEETCREQTLKAHLKETAELAKTFASAFGYGDWGYCCGMLHDIGKYSAKFQRRIRGSDEQVDHATAGAQLCRKLGGEHIVLSYCIAGHHAGLPDTGTAADTGSRGSWIGRMKKETEPCEVFETEIEIPKMVTKWTPQDKTKDPGFAISFLTRMLYSCLVDADYLNTEYFMKNGNVMREAGESMEVLWQKLRKYITKWLENEDLNSIKGRRTEILKACIAHGEEEQGIFTLTVPTGGGKTVASLAFALRHALEHGLERIIYVIPYTSIIEQNAQVFRDILGDGNVLEHHCNVEYERDETKNGNGKYESSEELHSMQLAAENWDKPVVVTTNVQFFESLFASKSTRCRKLHNIARAVIIFDEAQMLPNDYLKPCVAAMEELVRGYKSSVVLCTATQPALDQFFSQDMKIKELCPRPEAQFASFKRTVVKQLGKLQEEELLDRLRRETQALCILNTKKTVRNIYEKMEGEGVFHLSTLMYPAHRRRMIRRIKERLAYGREHPQDQKRCIVIATSLVEAGVDLDFETVYRQLAGVDSVVQAAGRCNREGARSTEESGTFVFELDDSQKVPGQEMQIDTARQIIRKYDDITEMDAIHEYFGRLYGFRGESLDKKRILEQFRTNRYQFAKVGKEFKLIEQNTRTVFIPLEPEAQKLLEEIRYKGMTKALMRRAGQFCVNIYENVFQRMQGAGMLCEASAELSEEFFTLLNPEDYSEKTGLKIDAELGIDIWL